MLYCLCFPTPQQHHMEKVFIVAVVVKFKFLCRSLATLMERCLFVHIKLYYEAGWMLVPS